MSIALKLFLTPLLIAAASLAGRRWGPAVSGSLIGLPFTSGPITFLLALARGRDFAAASALGTLSATLSQVAFCLAYAWLAGRLRWPQALVAGILAFSVVTIALQPLMLPVLPATLCVCAGLVLATRLLPKAGGVSGAAGTPPAWDLPARMVAATLLVLLLTSLAPMLGARLTGLLAPFPLYGTVLAVFMHQQRGPSAARRLLRGFVLGLSATVGFYFVLATLLVPGGPALAFVLALATALLLQSGSLWLLRAGAPSSPSVPHSPRAQASRLPS